MSCEHRTLGELDGSIFCVSCGVETDKIDFIGKSYHRYCNNKVMNNQKKFTRPELNAMAKKNGIKYYLKYNRFELAEKLGIELPKPKRSNGRKALSVEVLNPDGTTTVYPSINKAAKALGKHAMQIYT